MKSMIYVGFVCLLFLSACGQSGGGDAAIATARAGELNVTLSNAKGHLTSGQNEFKLEFKDAAGQPADVGAITLFFDMPAMGAMPYMKNDATLTTTEKAGVYRGTVNLEMKSTWQARLSFKGPAGEGQVNFPINAK
ncbi:MAG: FixH family protein [Blastocatellia bacterium]|nr:FixH family protein [Blastocatellia bacterium]